MNLKSMFKNFLGKSSKSNIPENSLIKKNEKLKTAQDTGSIGAGYKDGSTNPDDAASSLDDHVDIAQKIEELISSKSQEINANNEAVKEFDIRLNKMDGGLSSIRQNLEDVKDRLEKIDETQLELMSLYEVVSSTINPFVGDNNPGTAEKIGELEKKITALSATAPNMLSAFKEEFEAKFMEIEGKINSASNSGTLNEETLVEHVSGMVFEKISPLLEQHSQQGNNPAPVSRFKKADGQAKSGVKLTHLDNSAESSIVLLNWINFLLEKVGRNNIIDVIKYYIEIDWINEEVGSKMIDYTDGLDYYVEKPTWKLLPDDHVKSLMYIGMLTGEKIDKNIFSKLDLRNNVKDNDIYTISRL
ncbi:MAG: hypothetical protein OIN89_10625 [Candidatus Methanoperedens sp.]|nr:hypothetical protein [Candidatus Methanoperedens sp.]